MDVIFIALIGLVGIVVTGVIGPFVIARQLNRQRAVEQAEEWKRQDIVAERAATAANAIVEANRINGEAVLATSKVVIGKLETVHKLVNSNLTVSKEATLAALNQTLALMDLQAKPDRVLLVKVQQQALALESELEQRRMQDAAAQPGIEQTRVDEADLATLPRPAAPVPVPEPAAPTVSLPVVVSTDPAAVGVPVVIEGTMTTPPDEP